MTITLFSMFHAAFNLNIAQSTTNNNLSLYSWLATYFGLSMAIIWAVSDKGIRIMMADFVTDVHMLSEHTMFSVKIVKMFKIQTIMLYVAVVTAVKLLKYMPASF
jgi:hypothetical protein